MSTANVTESVLEVELVEQWRLDTLERAGYDAESAAVLAASPEVDLHLAVSLVKAAARSHSPSRFCCRAELRRGSPLRPRQRAPSGVCPAEGGDQRQESARADSCFAS